MTLLKYLLGIVLLLPSIALAQTSPLDISKGITVKQMNDAFSEKVDTSNGSCDNCSLTGTTIIKNQLNGENATFSTLNLTTSGQTTTPAAGDNGTQISNTFYVDRAVSNGINSIKNNPNLIGLQPSDLTITLCSSGCDYSTLSSAWTFALSQAHKLTGYNTITISISDGTYNEEYNVFTMDPMGKYIHIVGNTSDQTKVILNYTNTKGNNFSAFSVYNGGMIGLIDGVTITQPTDGSGAMKATDSSGIHTWNDQSFGSGIQVYGAGSNVELGSHVNVSNFYYGLVADNNGGIDAPSGGVTVTASGDVNMMARGGGVIVCTPCVASDASDNGTVSLGSNYDAERNGTLYIDGSTASKGWINGIVGITGGAIWAHQAKVMGPLVQNNGVGIRLWSNSKGEFTSATVQGGYSSGLDITDMSDANCDSCNITNNEIGILADGGRVTGGLTIQNNSQYGIQAIHQGSVLLFTTLSNMSGNGTNFTVEGSGTASTSNTIYASSSINVQ